MKASSGMNRRGVHAFFGAAGVMWLWAACTQPSQSDDAEMQTSGSGGEQGAGQGGSTAGNAAGGSGGASGAIAGRAGSTAGTGGSAGAPEAGRAGSGVTHDAGTAGAGGTPSAGSGGTSGQAMGGQAGTPVVMPATCGSFADCEDFEGYPLGPITGTKFGIEGGAAAGYTITSTLPAARGNSKKAVKIEPTRADRMLVLRNVDTKTAGGKSVFARVWMYFPALPKTSRAGEEPHYRLLRMLELAPTNNGVTVSAGVAGASKGRLLYYTDGGGSAARKDCASDGGNLPAGRWTCIELRADTSGYQAWIDGVSFGSANVGTGNTCWERHDKVAIVGFGFQNAAGSVDQDFSFYMDDIAVDTKRIGCK